MVTATLEPQVSAEDELRQTLNRLKVRTGPGFTREESVQFLESARTLTHCEPGHDGGPTDQEIECLRQATWKFRMETGDERVSGKDLIPVLQRLGYA
ncbi:MAG: hypothetical protein R3C49_17840 [Planctomycetaceae bacterium]